MKALIHAGLAGAIFAGAASAHAAPAAAATSYTLGATTDYRYRGISQTRLKPALQAGAEHVRGSGWYAGIWGSAIKWTGDAGGDGRVEIDLYGGKRGELAPGIGYDAGVLRYLYPGNALGRVAGLANADTTEIYGQLGVGPATLKYSHAVTNLFGFAASKGAGYLELNASLDAGKDLIVSLHAGRQRVRGNGAASYTDWKIGASRPFGPITVTLAATGTNAGRLAYASAADGSYLGKTALQLGAAFIF